ncbi:mechanosensitive ion channel-like protein [Mariniflexile fucanivorans]|uniref:Mechanosensitive ion channel-like protein n=1 Tax=Mariniflexile fucanivorans TaxID=264023 RepID=A0A4R1RHN1_9FLAO|nr:mechanosensitive ion channel domain-containing protein [Mariniflexile fucanivorans]TCL65583.1 mechanosensitive ion channel-like protein [Mariniflexile fucanivorans]
MEAIKQWTIENPTLYSVFKYVLLVAFVLILIQLLRRFLRKHVTDTDARYKSQKGIEIIGYMVLIVLSFSYFTGSIEDFTLAIGLFSAGIAFTLQELILSIAGSFFIFIVKVYKPGDRIEINGIKGDVIDVNSTYTTMMEIGQWVSSDNYSGRIVKLSNAFVFKGPIYNYSQDFPFIWDEFNLPIKYGSDIELAKSIVIKIASETLSEYTANSKSQWTEIVNKYYIEDAVVDPTLAVTLTDNWIQFNLRFIVDYKKRRLTKHILNDKILLEVEKTKGKVTLASTTFELIKIPELKVDVKNKI